MKPSEMNKEQLREARNNLQKAMYPVLETSRVTSLTDNSVQLEGGTFPATYYHSSGNLTIWGRGSRYAGGSMTVDELAHAEYTIQKYFDSHFQEEAQA